MDDREQKNIRPPPLPPDITCSDKRYGAGGERGVYSLDSSLKRSKIETHRECTWLSFFHRFSIGDSSVDHFSLSNLFASRSERISTLSWLITCKTEQITPDTDAAGDHCVVKNFLERYIKSLGPRQRTEDREDGESTRDPSKGRELLQKTPTYL